MKFINMLRLYWSDAVMQRARSFVFFLMSLILPVVTLFFWQGAFQKRSVIGGWTLEQMRSYYLFIVIAGSMLMSHIEIGVVYHQIKEGEIASKLLKPVSFLHMMMALEIPWRIIQGFFGFIVILMFILFNVQLQISSNLDVVLLGILISITAFIMSFLLKMTVSMLAFWFTDVNALLETQEVLIMVFAGLIMPIEMLPWHLYEISLATPFPYIIYFPVLAFIGKLPVQTLIQVLAMQWVWVGILYVIYQVLWKRGTYKFSGVGQ